MPEQKPRTIQVPAPVPFGTLAKRAAVGVLTLAAAWALAALVLYSFARAIAAGVAAVLP